MNREHLGDALDHWKGSVLTLLGSALRNVHVIPMFTDDDVMSCWSELQLQLYARLLRVPRNRIAHCDISFRAKSRKQYFEALRLPVHSDAFLDPDTGISTNSRRGVKHVARSELATLLPADTKRIVLVYQHSSRRTDYVEATLRRLSESTSLTGTASFAYNAGSVAMILISRSQQRLTEIRDDMIRTLEGVSRVTPIHFARPCAL